MRGMRRCLSNSGGQWRGKSRRSSETASAKTSSSSGLKTWVRSDTNFDGCMSSSSLYLYIVHFVHLPPCASGTCSPRDIGYLASAVQLFAASIFWVSTVTGVPDVIPSLDTAWPPAATTIIFFWTPQVIGGTGFIVASTLLMLEEQKTWWRIEPMRIGWHVAFWNLIGAIGFTLCGALGYASTLSTKVSNASGSNSPSNLDAFVQVNYQSVLSTFWGSWAFMIGSVAQLWEALWRAPPEDPSPQPQTERPSLN